VTVDIVARDQGASATLDKVRQQLELFPTFARNVEALGPPLDKATRGFEGLDLSASKATRAVRGLAVPLISELSPALGGTASAMGQVVSSALLLGRGFGALGIAAAGVAGVIGGALLQSWREGATAAEAYAKAVRLGDITALTAAVGAQADEVVRLGREYRELAAAAARARDEARGGGPEAVGAASVSSFFVAETERKADEARRALQDKQRELESAKAARAEGEALLAAERELKKLEETAERANLAALRSLRGAEDLGLDPIQARYRQRLREISDLRGDQGLASSLQAQLEAQARRERDEALRLREAATLGREAVEPGQGLEQVLAGATDEVTRMAIEAKQARLAIDELRESLERDVVPGTGLEQVLAGLSPEDRLRGARRAEQEHAEDLERQLLLTQQLATLNATRTDLALEQREQLSLEAIELERLLKLELARGDQAKEFGAEIEAQIKRQQVLEASDPIAGLKRGLTDLEVQFGSLGLRMQGLMQDIGGGMATALDDTFFSVITGQFEDLPDVARRFGADMVRAFTGELAKMATAAVFGQLRRSFADLFPGGGTLGSLPFGAASAAGGPAGYLAGGGVGSGLLLTESGRPLSTAEITAAYEAAGEAGVRALRAGDAAVIGGEFVQAGAGLEQVTAAAGAPPAAASRLTLRTGLGLAGSTALLGLTAYGATGAQTTADVVTGGVAGALSGATLGAQVGTLFGGAGGTIGGGVGALAGAAIASTIALLAKQEADRAAQKARQAAEVERAAGAGSDLVRSAGQATSIADFFRRVTAFGSGYTGGTANPAVGVSVETPFGPRAIGVPNPTYPVATLQDVLARPETLTAGIQAGVNPDLLAGPNAATSEALRRIAQDLVTQFREMEQGIGVTAEAPLADSGGLRRRTTVPATRAEQLGLTGGTLEIDELALSALTDEDRALLLLDVLAKVGADRDIVSTISDGATGQIVSITRVPTSTISLPGITPTTPAPPPGVPPAAIPAISEVAALQIPQFTEPAPLPPSGAPIFSSTSEGSGFQIGTEPVPSAVQAAYEAARAAYEQRRIEFYRPFFEQLSTTAKEQLAALTPTEVHAAINAGILTPTGVATLIQAGFLPQIAATLPADVRAQIGELQTDVGGAVSVGIPAGLPAEATVGLASLPPGTFSEAALQGLIAGLPISSIPFTGLNFSNLTSLQSLLAVAAKTIATFALNITNPLTNLFNPFAAVLGAHNVLSAAVAGQLAAQSGYADAFVGGQAPALPTSQGLTFPQQLALAVQGVPFVSVPITAENQTGYVVDPTFGYVDAEGNLVATHTAGNPSGLPTNPDATNFGQGAPPGSGATPSGGEPGGPGVGPGGGEGQAP
jgi:hypothetical protein